MKKLFFIFILCFCCLACKTTYYNIYSIATDKDSIWVASSVGLISINRNTLEPKYFDTSNSGLPNNDVRAIAIGSAGNKWVGTWGGGLANFYDGNWKVYNTSNSGLPNNFVKAIAIDIELNKWIGTWGGGLAKFDGKNWKVFNTSNSGLPSDTVTAIAGDKTGKIWVGTWGKGLAKLDGANWTVYDTSNSGLPSDTVTAIAGDKTGKIWVGTWGGGLAKLDGKDWIVYNKSNGGLIEKEHDYVNAIISDNNGNIWIGTNNSYRREMIGKWTVTEKKSGLTSVTNTGIYKNLDYGLYMYNDKIKILTPITECSGKITALFADEEGKLWIGGVATSTTYLDSIFYYAFVRTFKSSNFQPVLSLKYYEKRWWEHIAEWLFGIFVTFLFFYGLYYLGKKYK